MQKTTDACVRVLRIVALAAGISTTAFARDLFVATDGNDFDGDGTKAAPFKTLARAARISGPGDSVRVRGGVYTNREDWISCEGAPNAPILFRPYQGEQVIFDGSAMPADDPSSLLQFGACRHVVVEDFEVRHSSGRGLTLYDADHVTVRGCEVHHIAQRALGGSGDNLLFESNHVHNACLSNTDQAWGDGGWPAALATYSHRPTGVPVTNIVMRANRVHDNWGEGILLLEVEHGRIEGNRIWNNFSVNVYADHSRHLRIEGNSIYVTTNTYDRQDGDHGGTLNIALANEPAPAFPVLEDVVVANNDLRGGGRGISFYHYGNAEPEDTYRDIVIAYNVIRDTQSFAVRFAEVPEGYHPPTNALLQNNIIYRGKDGKDVELGNVEAWKVSHNDWPDGIPTVADGAESLSADPEFNGTGTATEDLRLLEGSPCIHAGTPVTDVPADFWGTPRHPRLPSIGIHEFVETLSVEQGPAQEMLLRWVGHDEARYHLQATTRLDAVSWADVAEPQTGIPNAAQAMAEVAPAEAHVSFYRLRVE